MNSKTGRTSAAVVGLMYSLLSAGSASAQWHSTAIGVLEYDTKHTWLALAGLGASPGGLGVKPEVGVQVYELGYSYPGTRNYVFSVQPYVGLADNYDGGAVAGHIGYAWANKTVSTQFPNTVAGDQGKGVELSGSWDQWGKNNDPMGYQVLGAYNFGSKSLWSRGRVTRNLTPGLASQRRVGAEVAYLEGNGFSAVQPGAVLEFHNPKGDILGLGAGMKFFGHGGGNAVYLKVEGVIPMGR